MEKFNKTLIRIFKYGPEPKDLFIVVGLLVAGIVVAVGTIVSLFISGGYLLIGLFELSLIKMLLGLVWCIVLAFFVAIIIITICWFGENM